jgi:hypothetical protein
MTKLVITIGVALMVTSAVHAQTSPTDPQARIAASVQRAAAAGIPTALLQLKVQEGRAKGVAAERIAAAVERRERSLITARRQLADIAGIGSQDLAVAADALEAGVSVAALRQVASRAPAERRVVAIAVLTQLAQAGVPVEAAAAQVLDGASSPAKSQRSSRAFAGERGSAGDRSPPEHARGTPPAGISGGPPASLPQPVRRGEPRSGRNRP